MARPETAPCDGPASLSRRSVIWLAGAALAAIAPHGLHLPLWISASALIAVMARPLLPLRCPHLAQRLVVTGLAISMGAGVFARYGTLAGRDAGVALLVGLLALKLLEGFRLRDAMLVVFLSYFVLGTGFFFNQGIAAAAYACAALVVITAVLVQLHEGDRPLPWRFRLRSTAGLLVQATPAALILFLLFPRISGPLWSLRPDPAAGVTGLSEEMSPGAISTLVRSDQVAFRVTFEGTPPRPEQRYWRGPVLSRFDGRVWRAGTAADRRPPLLQGRDTALRYQVSLAPHNKRWLFALEMPVRIPRGAGLDGDYRLLSAAPVRSLLRYRVASALEYTLGAELTARERQQALQLPRDLSPRVRDLARAWHADSPGAGAVVDRALGYFHRKPFFYTLTPPRLGEDPVATFLFETRQGFCEHYAGSFVVLMRAAGVPARVVTGYQGGEWNPLGGYMLVRQSDAHAWAEVWLGGRGWVRIDPTAAVAPERIRRGITHTPGIREALPLLNTRRYARDLFHGVRLLWDNVNYQWDKWVVAFGPQRQRALLRQIGFQHPDWTLMTLIMAAGLVGIGLLFGGLTLWRNRPQRVDPLRAAYARFTRKMAAAGLRPQPHEGPRDYARRIATHRPELGAPVQAITDLYAQLRYGRTGPPQGIARLNRLIGRLGVRRRGAGSSSAGEGNGDPDAGRPPGPRGGSRTGPG
jgi:transglutaminase-like putative cysteine protease